MVNSVLDPLISDLGFSVDASQARGRKDKQDYHKIIKTAGFREAERIIDPELPEAKQLATMVQSIAQRLLGKRYDASRHQFTFLFSDLPDPNGFIVPKAKPAIIVTTLALIRNAKTIDELAGYLAHELGHLYIEEEFGSQRQRNSKAEEAAADLYSMKALIDAGYSPQGISDLIEGFKDPDTPWAPLVDVHPLSKNRLSLLAKTKISVAREGYNTTKAVCALPAEWRANVKPLHYVSPLEEKQKLDGYDRMDAEAKLNWVRQEAKSLYSQFSQSHSLFDDPSVFNNYAEQFKARRKVLDKIYRDISISSNSSSQVAAVHKTFNTLIECEIVSESGFYQNTLRKLNMLPNKGKWPLIGKLRDTQQHINAFLTADSASVAELAAETLKTSFNEGRIGQFYAIENHGQPDGTTHNTLQNHLGFSTVLLPSQEELNTQSKNAPVELPYSKHLRWLKEKDSSLITYALKLIGATDFVHVTGTNNYETPGLIGDITHFPLPATEKKEEFSRLDRDINKGEYVAGLVFDEQFKVAGIVKKVISPLQFPAFEDKTSPEDFKKEMRQYAQQRVLWEQGILKEKVYWNLLETNPKQFCDIYSNALFPVLSIEPMPHPFAKAIVEKIEQLAKTDVQKAYSTLACMDHYLAINSSSLLSSTDKRYDVSLPAHLAKQFRVGIDPSDPLLNLPPVKNQKTAFGPFINKELLNNLRYTNIFERKNPLDESHICYSRKKLNYKKSKDVRSDVLKEFVATDIADDLLKNPASLSLKDYLKHNRIISELPDTNTLKQWLQRAIKEPLKQATLRFGTQPLDTQIAEFKKIDQTGLFRDVPDLRKKLIDSVLHAIEAKPDAKERKQATFELLYEKKQAPLNEPTLFFQKKHKTYHCKLSLPEQRNKASKFIADGVQAEFGTDDGTTKYADAILPEIDKIFKKTSGLLRVQAMSDLCERINSQEAVSKHVERKLPQQTFLDLTRKEPAFRVGEFLKEESIRDESLRYAVINFLATPYSATKAEDIYIKASKRFTEYNTKGIPRYKPAFIDAIADMHMNFLSAPLAVRATILHDFLFDRTSKYTASLMIDQILDRAIGKEKEEIVSPFKDDSKLRTFFDPYRDQIKAIEQKLAKKSADENWHTLPADERAGKTLYTLGRMSEAHQLTKTLLKQATIEFGSYGARLMKKCLRKQLNMIGLAKLDAEELSHLTVRSYLSAVDQEEAQLLATALLIASQERGEGEALSIGNTLNLVLSNMGPAGAKMLQAIHSNPSTPDDIRQELKNSKVEHEKPYRFNVVSWAIDAGLADPNNPDRAIYFGPVKGSGSFGVTMFNTDIHHKQVADTILRPRAAEKAAREFKLMDKAGKMISYRDSRMNPVLSMICEAERSARIETKMHLAAEQNKIAAQVYGGIEITITHPDGSTADFKHQVMPLLSYGKMHKRVDIAEGPHFNDIPAGATHESTLHKRDIAVSVVALQIIARFAGLPVDRDRHGGNIKIHNNTIQHFDFGAMELMLPTSDQKKALGKVVAQAVKDYGLKGGDFTTHLLRRVENVASSDDTKNFLSGFMRETLALGDYRNAGVDQKVLKGILGMAIYGESADREIQASFKRECGALLEFKIRRELQSAAAESGIQVKGVKAAQTLTMPDLSAEDRALFRAPKSFLAAVMRMGRDDRQVS